MNKKKNHTKFHKEYSYRYLILHLHIFVLYLYRFRPPQLYHISSLLSCLCCPFIQFGNFSPTLTSLNMKNVNVPPTWHQSLSLAPTLFYGCFNLWPPPHPPFFFFFPFIQNEWLSVFPKQKYVHQHPQTNRSTGSAFTVLQSCPSRRICKSNYRPVVFREKECVPNNGKIKCGRGEGEEDGRSGHGGGLYVLVKVALRNKSSFECAPTQKRD